MSGYAADDGTAGRHCRRRLLMLTRLTVPIGVPSGARMRLPRRMKIGALDTSRMVMFETVTSSVCAPSTLSSASPREVSNTMLEMAILRKSPSDSVPILIRPVGPVAIRRLFHGAFVSAVQYQRQLAQ